MKKFRFLVRPLSLAALLTLTAGTAAASQVIVVTPTVSSPTQSGNDLLAAYNGITGANWGNRFLVQLEPGVYNLGNQNLVMKPWVSLAGSGVDTTFVYGNGNQLLVGLDRGLIEGASDAELRDLSIRVFPVDERPFLVPIFLDGTSPKITNVLTQAFSGRYCSGIRAIDSSPDVQDVVVLASCPGESDESTGMWFTGDGSNPTILRVNVIASSAPHSRGIHFAQGAGGTVRDSSFVAGGGLLAYGLGVQQLSLLGLCPVIKVVNTTIIGRDASGSSIGIRSNFNCAKLNLFDSLVQATGQSQTVTGIDYVDGGIYPITVENGLIEGATRTVFADDAMVLIGSSRLEGGPALAVGTGTITCAGVYDENFTFSANTCP